MVDPVVWDSATGNQNRMSGWLANMKCKFLLGSHGRKVVYLQLQAIRLHHPKTHADALYFSNNYTLTNAMANVHPYTCYAIPNDLADANSYSNASSPERIITKQLYNY
jgi:hypothetical protein